MMNDVLLTLKLMIEKIEKLDNSKEMSYQLMDNLLDSMYDIAKKNKDLNYFKDIIDDLIKNRKIQCPELEK